MDSRMDARNTHKQITSRFVEFADNYFFLTFFNLNLIVRQFADEGANERALLVEQSTTQRQIAIIGERRKGSRWTLRKGGLRSGGSELGW